MTEPTPGAPQDSEPAVDGVFRPSPETGDGQPSAVRDEAPDDTAGDEHPAGGVRNGYVPL